MSMIPRIHDLVAKAHPYTVTGPIAYFGRDPIRELNLNSVMFIKLCIIYTELPSFLAEDQEILDKLECKAMHVLITRIQQADSAKQSNLSTSDFVCRPPGGVFVL